MQDFEQKLLEHMQTRHSEVGKEIKESGKLEDDTKEKLKKAVEEFKSSYTQEVDTIETAAATEGVPETDKGSEGKSDEGGEEEDKDKQDQKAEGSGEGDEDKQDQKAEASAQGDEEKEQASA